MTPYFPGQSFSISFIVFSFSQHLSIGASQSSSPFTFLSRTLRLMAVSSALVLASTCVPSWVCIPFLNSRTPDSNIPSAAHTSYWLVPQGLCSRHYLRLCLNPLRYLSLSLWAPAPASAWFCFYLPAPGCWKFASMPR